MAFMVQNLIQESLQPESEINPEVPLQPLIL